MDLVGSPIFLMGFLNIGLATTAAWFVALRITLIHKINVIQKYLDDFNGVIVENDDKKSQIAAEILLKRLNRQLTLDFMQFFDLSDEIVFEKFIHELEVAATPNVTVHPYQMLGYVSWLEAWLQVHRERIQSPIGLLGVLLELKWWSPFVALAITVVTFYFLVLTAIL